MHRTRDYRRAQRERAIQRVMRWLKTTYLWEPRTSAQYGDQDWLRDNAVRRHQTPHPCSCYGCGNPRHHFDERTMQERRWLCEPVGVDD